MKHFYRHRLLKNMAHAFEPNYKNLKKQNHEIELLEMRCLAVGIDGNGLYVLM